MNHIEGKFAGEKGSGLYYQGWLPDTKIKAVLIVVHGIAEHTGRYLNLINYLVPEGFAVYGFDLRGHGKSEGKKGCVEHFAFFATDLNIFVKLIQNRHHNQKIFLFGHSMGSIICLSYVQRFGGGLNGLAISATAIRLKPDIPVFIKAILLPVAKFLPELGLIKLNSATLSRDSAVVEAYDNDPLVYRGKLSARLVIEFIWNTIGVDRRLAKIHLPLIILHGSADHLVDPSGSYMVSRKVSSRDKTLNIYHGMYHEILNEPEREKVLIDLKNWLNQHSENN